MCIRDSANTVQRDSIYMLQDSEGKYIDFFDLDDAISEFLCNAWERTCSWRLSPTEDKAHNS